MLSVSEILLWLFVLNLGTAFGAGLYETRVVLPQWFSKAPEGGYQVDSETMRATDPGRRFWGPVTTLPLTLLTLANLVAAWGGPAPRHAWWIGAVALALLERAGTFTYFIPTALRLQRDPPLPSALASPTIAQWLRLNYVRNVLTLLAWLVALRALTFPAS